MHAAERESHVRSYQSLWERACVQIREGRRLQHEKKKPVRRASGEYRGCDCVQRDGQDVFRPGIVRRAVKAGCSRHALLASRFDVRWAVLRVPQLTRDEHVLSVEPASECSRKRVAHFFLVSVCVCSVCIMRGAARVEHASNVMSIKAPFISLAACTWASIAMVLHTSAQEHVGSGGCIGMHALDVQHAAQSM
jgi:hypothetical protein